MRAASGEAADDQDPETNGMAENEDGRLEMDNLLKQLGETLREVEKSMRKWAEDLQAEMEWEQQQQLPDSQVGSMVDEVAGTMLNEPAFRRDTLALVLAAADEDGDGMLSVDEVDGGVDDREPKKAMRKEFGMAGVDGDGMISNVEEMFVKIAEKQDDYEKTNLMKKYLEMLAETAETSDHCNIKAKIAELFRVNTSKSWDVQPRLNEHVDRMKEKLNGIYRTKIAEFFDFVTMCLEMFAEIVQRKDEHEKFYEQFATCLKLGIHEGSINRANGAELLRLSTSKSGDEQVCLKEYIDRVKEGQNVMYHNTGDSIAVVSSSPFLEKLRKLMMEVLGDKVENVECIVEETMESLFQE